MSPSRGGLRVRLNYIGHASSPALLFSFRSRRHIFTLPKLHFFEALDRCDPKSTAIIHSSSRSRFTYGALLRDTTKAKDRLQKITPLGKRLEGQRIAFMIENGYEYVVTLLSILATHGIAVPLNPAFPASEIRYVLNDSSAFLLLSSGRFQQKTAEVCKEGLHQTPVVESVEEIQEGGVPADGSKHTLGHVAAEGAGAIMLYTSGTTSKPKGVLLPQATVTAQCQSLLEAWKYSPRDRLLHVLPLHHIHGVVNAVMAPLLAGSSIEFMFPFNANAVWERLVAPFLEVNKPDMEAEDKISVFTAVPTIYNRLISTYSELPNSTQEAAKKATSPENLRLTMSGSAALPSSVRAAWTSLSEGNVLLERYGMTEVGMAFSGGLKLSERVDGSVGWPLPSVEARLVDIDTKTTIEPGDEVDDKGNDRQGEIQLRGPTIFRGYWQNPGATQDAFVHSDDGGEKWLKTGDLATRKVCYDISSMGETWTRGPMYFIKGRSSVDIIKTGGEKVSALEVERELLSLPQISEAAVVGLPSDVWGQKVAAIVVLKPELSQSGKGGKSWGAMDMRRALKERLANYKIPQELKVIPDELPRNAMGKVNKKNLIELYFGDKTN